jgi:hypothetical protein
MVSCRGFGGERALDYNIDPTLQSGWAEGKRSRVDWTGIPGPGFYTLDEWCSWSDDDGKHEAEGHGAGRITDATASGTIMGKTLDARPARFAIMEMGARVTDCPFVSHDDLVDIAGGGAYRYSYRSHR